MQVYLLLTCLFSYLFLCGTQTDCSSLKVARQTPAPPNTADPVAVALYEVFMDDSAAATAAMSFMNCLLQFTSEVCMNDPAPQSTLRTDCGYYVSTFQSYVTQVKMTSLQIKRIYCSNKLNSFLADYRSSIQMRDAAAANFYLALNAGVACTAEQIAQFSAGWTALKLANTSLIAILMPFGKVACGF